MSTPIPRPAPVMNQTLLSAISFSPFSLAVLRGREAKEESHARASANDLRLKVIIHDAGNARKLRMFAFFVERGFDRRWACEGEDCLLPWSLASSPRSAGSSLLQTLFVDTPRRTLPGRAFSVAPLWGPAMYMF